jgi:hypothetical protein
MFTVLDGAQVSYPYRATGKIMVFDILMFTFLDGARGSVVIKALCYKGEGRGFDTR